MKVYNYHFDIPNILAQFEYAFNNILVKRYHKDRTPADTIRVRFVYAPKSKILYDLVDPQKNFQLPAIAIVVKSISRDDHRMVNTILANEYINYDNNSVAKYNTPMPVNIDIEFSIITRNEDDLWQIISNIAPYPNPYITISWAVPEEFNLPNIHEIRSEVLWNGNISLDFPTNVDGKSDIFYNATTNFTIKSFIFKPESPSLGTIIKIDSNFYNGLNERDYTDGSLSAIQNHKQYDATVINTSLSSYKINTSDGELQGC